MKRAYLFWSSVEPLTTIFTVAWNLNKFRFEQIYHIRFIWSTYMAIFSKLRYICSNLNLFKFHAKVVLTH